MILSICLIVAVLQPYLQYAMGINMRKKVLLLVLLCSILGFNAGCQKDGKADAAKGTAESSTSEIMKVTESGGGAQTNAVGDSQNSEGVKLYISTGDGKFQSYDYSETEEATPDSLVKAMETLTGWNISLADQITTGKGGMTVCITGESAVFMGPPSNQKENFHVYDAQSMVYAVLDSIQKTLQTYASPKNPESVDIYYCMEGNVPIRIDNLDVTIPMDQPYTHEVLAKLFQHADAPTGTGSTNAGGNVRGSKAYGQTDAGNTTDGQGNYEQPEVQGDGSYQQPGVQDGQEGYQQPGTAESGAYEQPGVQDGAGNYQQLGVQGGEENEQPEVTDGQENYQEPDVSGPGDIENQSLPQENDSWQ